MKKETRKGLKPNTERTPEELAENGRKGGLKAAERRRKKKEMRELLSDFLSTPVALKSEDIPEEVVNVLKAAGYTDITLKERGALLLALKMSRGDIRASLLVSKMIGEYKEDISDDINAVDEERPRILIQCGDATDPVEIAELLREEV